MLLHGIGPRRKNLSRDVDRPLCTHVTIKLRAWARKRITSAVSHWRRHRSDRNIRCSVRKEFSPIIVLQPARYLGGKFTELNLNILSSPLLNLNCSDESRNERTITLLYWIPISTPQRPRPARSPFLDARVPPATPIARFLQRLDVRLPP
jgi:hypothetical protein